MKGVCFMTKCATDLRLISGILIAHLLLFLTYQDNKVFWYIFSATMLFLISYSILMEKMEDEASLLTYVVIGIVSGLLIYSVFACGNIIINYFDLPFANQITKLYNRYAPTELWHYIALVLIIVPGEEIFWRGFVQKRILKKTNWVWSIILSTIFYSTVQIYSFQMIHIVAALVGGTIWGLLYVWKRSVPLVVVSHLTFSLLTFVFLPFR